MPTPLATPAIAVRGVHKRFGTVHALRGIDLAVERGEFFGLLGPNGAGKSTLINIMAGLTHASAGNITIHGHDVVRDYRQTRCALGVVPQELVYDPFFTVREILTIQSGYFGLGRTHRAWVEELITTLNLTEKADTNVQRLSGGMKRRVLIAQALVHRPPVVVLDEPTAGVDVELRQVLWRFTRRLHDEGHTIVLTTHYLGEAEALCERIAILHHGALIALDTKEALLARYPYRMLVVTPSEPVVSLPSALEDRVVARDGAALTLRIHRTHEPVGTVLDALRDAGVQVMDLQTRDAGLEEVFLDLTRGREREGTA
jgi:ABC-2 type transport system ATP-binding protein